MSAALRRPFIAGVVTAIVVTSAGILAIVSGLEVSSGVRQHVGPQVMPVAAGLGLSATGLFLLARAFKGGWSCEAHDPGSAPPFSRNALLWILLALAVNMLTIGWVGFAPASVVLFAAVARASGSKAIKRDILVAIVLVVLLELLFGRVLGLRLGGGPLDLLLSEWHPT